MSIDLVDLERELCRIPEVRAGCSAERTVAITTIVLLVPPHEEVFTGSAPVRGAGDHEAVARSVLDAVNRRLHERR